VAEGSGIGESVGRAAARRNDEIGGSGRVRESATGQRQENAMSDMIAIRQAARRLGSIALAAMLALLSSMLAAPAADPIKVGFSMALTGAVAPNGKQVLAALEIWRDDVNAKGGLLGRPVELVYYDDQSNPATVPGIYTKLISVDKVNLLLGPYATNMAAPAMPVIMNHKMTTISILAIGVNRHFNYDRYFSMVPVGPEGVKAFSQGFFEIAAAQNPKPQTVAIVAADAEFAVTSADGARANAQALGFKIVHDKTYPPGTTDLTPVVRAVQAANADVVFVAAYPPDTVGVVRAANEIGLTPKMFGGTMIGLLATPIKMTLGPLMNGLVIMEVFVPAPTFNFPGLQEVLKRYGERAAAQKIDPLGYGFVPFGYAAGQILARAVEETKGLDHDKIAAHIHANTFSTIAGEIAFGKDGEWRQPRMLFTQFQNIAAGDLNQFRDTKRQVVLWPAAHKTGDIIYPYANAKK
jgi:branched-chain amino acid transport system substrate-binding protein